LGDKEFRVFQKKPSGSEQNPGNNIYFYQMDNIISSYNYIYMGMLYAYIKKAFGNQRVF